jgi:hypothetical protein
MASRGQPRLAIVVNTMRSAAVDLVHLFIVFGIIFIAYVVSGHILFGRRMEPFATLEGSIAFTFGIVLMKEFDFQTLTEQDFLTSCIWVWTFVLLVVLVLINIILAMIFDTYGEVRSHVLESDSLGFTLKRIFDQLRLFNVWVSNSDLLLTIRQLSEKSSTVSMQDLREVLPDISNTQMMFLFNQCKNKVESKMTMGNKNALPEAIASVLMGVASLKDGVAIMDPRQKPMGLSDTYKTGESVPISDMTKSKIDDQGISELDEEEQLVLDASGQPKWLRMGLLPFLEQQKASFNRAYDDLYSVESQLIGRGVDAKIPKTGYPKPADPKSQTNDPLVLPWTVLEQAEMRKTMQELGRTARVASAPPSSGVPPSIGKADRTVSA